MNIEFGDKQADVEREEVLIVCGEEVGYMKTYVRDGRTRYHAGFHLVGGIIGLIQGHGETKEEAIKNAIRKGRSDSTRLLMSIDELENKLMRKE